MQDELTTEMHWEFMQGEMTWEDFLVMAVVGAMNRGSTFVYLDSKTDNTLTHFLGQKDDEIEQEYETDSEYNENNRAYDD